MNRIMEIMRAIMAAIGRLVSRTVTVTKNVGGKLVSVAETSVERVFDAAVAAPRVALDIGGAGCKLVVGAIGDVVRAPFKLAGAMLGGGRGRPQTAQSAAADEASAQRAAQQEAEARQASADRQAEARELVAAVRSVAAARARGERLDDVALGRLPDEIRHYLANLEAEECSKIASASVMGLRGVLRGQPPSGVRTPRQVRQDAELPPPTPEQVAARREQIRQAARAAMRGEKPQADDYEATIRGLTAA